MAEPLLEAGEGSGPEAASLSCPTLPHLLLQLCHCSVWALDALFVSAQLQQTLLLLGLGGSQLLWQPGWAVLQSLALLLCPQLQRRQCASGLALCCVPFPEHSHSYSRVLWDALLCEMMGAGSHCCLLPCPRTSRGRGAGISPAVWLSWFLCPPSCLLLGLV